MVASCVFGSLFCLVVSAATVDLSGSGWTADREPVSGGLKVPGTTGRVRVVWLEGMDVARGCD